MRSEKPSPQQIAIQNSKFNNLGKMNTFMQKVFQDSIDEDTRIREQIKRLERKRERLNSNSPSVEDFLIALAKQLMKTTGGKSYEIYGPFGLGCERSIYILDDDSGKLEFHSKDKNKDNIFLSLTFVSGGCEGLRLQTNIKTNEYGKDTIGALNGMNYVRVDLTKDMNLEWIIKNYGRKGLYKKIYGKTAEHSTI